VSDWLGLHLDLEPERPELPLRAPGVFVDEAAFVRQWRPARADLRWLDAGGTLLRAAAPERPSVASAATDTRALSSRPKRATR
jgi:hypothetical protein